MHLAKQLVTGRPMGGDPWIAEVLSDAAVVEEAGRIAWVGKEGDLASCYKTAPALRHEGLVPGLLDAHTHMVFGGDRYEDFEWRAEGKTYAEIANAGGGIRSTVRQTRAASTQTLVERAKDRLEKASAQGSCAWEIKSGYGLDHETELRMLEVVADLAKTQPIRATYLGLHAIPEGRSKADYVNEVLNRTLPEVHRRGLAQAVDIFVEEGYFDADDARKLAASAKPYGFDVRMHVDQFADRGGAILAAELGARTADHLEHTGEEGIRALAEAGVIPVLLPASVFGLGFCRYPNARQMIERGLPVVLATDCNPGSSPTLSLPMVMAIACRYMKMAPMEALIACTRHAAFALRWEDEYGTIEVGKRAALYSLPEADYRSLACWF